MKEGERIRKSKDISFYQSLQYLKTLYYTQKYFFGITQNSM